MLAWGRGDPSPKNPQEVPLAVPTSPHLFAWLLRSSICGDLWDPSLHPHAHQLFSPPGPASHGERVTPHWLLGGRTRRAVSMDEQVRTETAPVPHTVLSEQDQVLWD